jgi:hypothetical protein
VFARELHDVTISALLTSLDALIRQTSRSRRHERNNPLLHHTTQAVRLFLFMEAAAFLVAASLHFGVLIHGYEHQKAGTAESVIGVALLVGLMLTAIRPDATRGFGLAAQAFALLGTLVGIFTIAIGVGPRTAPDIAFHIGIVIVLVSGLVVAMRG